MEAPAVQTKYISLHEFMTLYGDDGPFEWIDGERIPVSPQVLKSSDYAGLLYRKLADFVEDGGLGKVYVEAPFVLIYDVNWIKGSRTPDVMFVTADHIARLAATDPAWSDKPLIGPPALVIEIVSPTDRMTDVNRKVRRYLADGVQMIWVIEPGEKTVTIYRAGKK